MRTAGIDLATTAAKTAVCVVDWSDDGLSVEFGDDATDGGLLRVCRDGAVEKIGIDCPFGWPAPFVAAISAHALGQPWPGQDKPVPAAFADTLAYRLTDLRIKEKPLCARPLSVAADKIGKTAMRGALILDALEVVDRSGRSGRIAEVYPAASLRQWGLHHHLKHEGRDAVLKQLEELMRPMTFQPGAHALCMANPALRIEPGTRGVGVLTRRRCAGELR